jgi:3-oxoacyl-[acyl-carrier protein] reductase
MAVSSTSEPRVAIVTGGSRGIGRGVVQRLAADGLRVAVGYAANRAEADAAVTEAQAAGVRGGGVRGGGVQAIAVSADVGDEHAVAALFDQVEETFGGIDVVVNAAGLMSLAPLADFDLAVLDRMLRTNIRGTFVVDQQAARSVRPGGTIINFSSSVLGRVLPTYTGYAASKAAVEAMTFILAHELRGRDVTVNAVAPGPTATDMFLEGKDQALLDRLASAVPLERLGVPADIAPVVAFLASPEGHWVNGQTIRVNGGII